MFIKVLIQGLLTGIALLALHLFGHIWPLVAEKPEILDLFSGPMKIVHGLLSALAFPLDHLFGWMWTSFTDLNYVGPILLGFLVTGLLMRRKNAKAGVSHA